MQQNKLIGRPFQHSIKTPSMKKILVASLLVMSCLTVLETSAQLSAGQVQVGGFLQFNMAKSDQTSTNNESFSLAVVPRVAKMINDRTAIGVQLIGQFNRSEYTYLYDNFITTSQIYTTRNVGGGVYMINYIPLTDKVYFHFNNNLIYTNNEVVTEHSYSSTVIDPTPSSTTQSNSVSVFIQPGLTVSLTNRWAVQANIGYLGYEYDVDQNDNATSSYGATWNSIQFGTFVNF